MPTIYLETEDGSKEKSTEICRDLSRDFGCTAKIGEAIKVDQQIYYVVAIHNTVTSEKCEQRVYLQKAPL